MFKNVLICAFAAFCYKCADNVKHFVTNVLNCGVKVREGITIIIIIEMNHGKC